jgi:hypothetical protein
MVERRLLGVGGTTLDGPLSVPSPIDFWLFGLKAGRGGIVWRVTGWDPDISFWLWVGEGGTPHQLGGMLLGSWLRVYLG